MTAGAPTKDQYAQLVIAHLKDVGLAELWYVPEKFEVGYWNSRGDTHLNLMPTYREFCAADTGDREAILDKVATTAGEVGWAPETWEEAAPLLRPVLRPADYNLAVRSASRAALPFLREFLVVDRPTSMSYVNDDQLSEWGVDAETAFITARANLETTRGGGRQVDLSDQSLTVYRRPGEEYLTSLLLLRGWLADLVCPEGHRPVVAVPDKETLLIAADVPDLLPELVETAEQAYNDAARPISPQVYTVDDTGAVVPYPVHDGHPAAEAVRRADAILAFHTYHGQKEWLEEKYQEEGEDIFVASLLGMDADDGSFRTVATWTDGIRTLLPRADLVAFQSPDPDTQPFTAAWSDAAELVDLTPVPDLDPPRYEVSGWPDRTAVARLRIRAMHR